MVDLDNTGESFLVEDDREATMMWKYGIALWKLPGVMRSCLGWQVLFGFDVTFLVFLSWVGCIRRESIGVEQVQAAKAEISRWRLNLIEPVRDARKYVEAKIRTEQPGIADVLALLRAVELRSELCEQTMLLQWWRTQERTLIGEDGFRRSVMDYMSTLAPLTGTADEGELRRICGLIASIEV